VAVDVLIKAIATSLLPILVEGAAISGRVGGDSVQATANIQISVGKLFSHGKKYFHTGILPSLIKRHAYLH
jgi:hypothetical protein